MRYWLLKKVARWCGFRVQDEWFWRSELCLVLLMSTRTPYPVVEIRPPAPLEDPVLATAADRRVH